MSIITVNEFIAILTNKDTKITYNLIESLCKQIAEHGLNFPTDKDVEKAIVLLVKLLNYNINPFERLMNYDPRNDTNNMKNLITLIMQLTKELIKIRFETLKTFSMNLISNNTSNFVHIKPFVNFVLNYKSEVVSPILNCEMITQNELPTVTDD